MKIQLTDKFYIEQCLHAPFNWDLIKINYGIRGGKETRIDTPVAYGLTLEHLIKKIPEYQIFEKEEEFIELKNFIKEYKKISEEVASKLLKSLKK